MSIYWLARPKGKFISFVARFLSKDPVSSLLHQTHAPFYFIAVHFYQISLGSLSSSPNMYITILLLPFPELSCQGITFAPFMWICIFRPCNTSFYCDIPVASSGQLRQVRYTISRWAIIHMDHIPHPYTLLFNTWLPQLGVRMFILQLNTHNNDSLWRIL